MADRSYMKVLDAAKFCETRCDVEVWPSLSLVAIPSGKLLPTRQYISLLKLEGAGWRVIVGGWRFAQARRQWVEQSHWNWTCWERGQLFLGCV
jgi:hypothetical protein